ncbi:MAG: hypothetical protein AB1791_10250, partial [Chloroflexota bacterium]
DPAKMSFYGRRDGFGHSILLLLRDAEGYQSRPPFTIEYAIALPLDQLKVADNTRLGYNSVG